MRKMIQGIILLSGFMFLFWFLLPFLSRRILNIGNLTGIIVFSCVVLYGIFFSRINDFVRKVWEKPSGKLLLGIFAVVGVIILFLTITFSLFMIFAAKQKPVGNPTVVVLGCRVYGENASLMLMERLESAEKYLNKNPDALCIVSGGQGEGELISEAECMFRYLKTAGIDPIRIYKEDQSTSTRENLLFSRKIMLQEKLNEEVLIVTNEFHLYRSSKIAKSLGLSSFSLPAKTAWWLFPTYYVRELYGIISEIVF